VKRLLLAALLALTACSDKGGAAITTEEAAKKACDAKIAGLDIEAGELMNVFAFKSGGWDLTYDARDIDGLHCVVDEDGVMELGQAGEAIWQRTPPQN